ncbi:MAG TPA: ATP-grasp domain-containing protein [Methanothermobacter sp.]|nr:conserved hypothetical protein [Methanothermobacter sp. MT-2]HHW05577.1 ATP-grasp domain-containing protein [Methanothermobacter sp.]HOK72677.1 ATP-grasp domain-containing protein [Methanothermobacter sp.]HOL68603.1 ATP-grasp domain-containing protein [Methanothermobacter sp.]HPQ04362.1 ATP-grasp domain-containing protein [Methanothermobacter sp.]
MKILFIGARLFNDVAEYTKKMGITTILTESNPKSPNLHLADKYHIVPRGMEAPMEIALQEDVDAIVPLIGVDPPLIQVARMKEKLEKEYNIPVIASNTKTTIISTNKIKTKKFFEKNNIKTPKYHIIKEGEIPKTNYPTVLKQEKGQGGQNLLIAKDKNSIKSYLKSHKKAMMEDYINGHEISVEVLRWNHKSSPLVVVDKGKTTTQGIHPLKKTKKAPAKIPGLNNRKVLRLAQKITEKLQAEGNTDIDMIFNPENRKLYAIEVNTRPSGTRYISAASTGIHPLEQLVNMAIGEWKPEKLTPKKFHALEIPVGKFEYEKPPKTFKGENSWILHGPEGHRRITIRAANEKKAEEILKKLNIR